MPVDQPSTSLRRILQPACSLARRLCAVHGAQGRPRSRRVDEVGSGHCRAATRGSRAVVTRPGARDSTPQADAVSVLRSVGARPRALPRTLDRHSGRSANLRGPRQRRRLVAPRSLSSRPHGTADGRGGRTTRLLQCHRPALGQSALRLEAPRANRLRMVDRSGSHDADARRSRTTRSFPRVCRLVGNSRRRHDRHSRRMEARTRCGAVRGDSNCTEHVIRCRLSPKTSA